MTKIEIPLKYPSLNQYINACRAHWSKGAKMVREWTDATAIFTARLPKFEEPIRIHFIWFAPHENWDIDNRGFARKVIIDTMRKQKKIKNDNIRYVKGFTESYEMGEYKLLMYIY